LPPQAAHPPPAPELVAPAAPPTPARRRRSVSPPTLFRRIRGPPTLCSAFSLADFGPRKKIGSGAQAIVYSARFLGKGLGGKGSGLSPGTDVCLKEFTDLAAGRRERAALDGLAPHPNVVRCYGAFETSRAIYLVLELCSHDLTRAVTAGPRQRAYLTTPQKLALLKATARGLAHLHAHDVLHCDLKLENVMVGVDGRPRLVDFGLAQPFRAAPAEGCYGTVYNMAPEVLDPRSRVYGERYSAWQFGLVMAQVLWGTAEDAFSRALEWPMLAIMDLQYHLPAVRPGSPLTEAEDAALRALLTDHLLVHEGQRLTIDELLMHPFFAAVQDP